MNFTEIERAIVDLTIISQLRKNSKISVYDPSYLAIQDHIPLLTPVLRAIYGDDNVKTIGRIKSLINNCDRYLGDRNVDANLRQQLIGALGKSIPGLKNLKYTYKIYDSGPAQIKLIIKQVRDILKRETPPVTEVEAITEGKKTKSGEEKLPTLPRQVPLSDLQLTSPTPNSSPVEVEKVLIKAATSPVRQQKYTSSKSPSASKESEDESLSYVEQSVTSKSSRRGSRYKQQDVSGYDDLE